MRLGSWDGRLFRGEDPEQRREGARVAAVMDDGQLGAEIRSGKGQEAQDTEGPPARDNPYPVRPHTLYPRRAIRCQWAATFFR